MPKFTPPRNRRWSLRGLARLVGAGRPGAARPGVPGADDVALVAASGMFDRDLYLAQLAAGSPEPDKAEDRDTAELIAHYLRKGSGEWLSPSRAFDPGYYRALHPDLARTGEDPLLHYIRAGRHAGAEAVARATDWEPKDVPSTSLTTPVRRGRRVFLVPAFLTERNTTRYRVHHLSELLGADAITVVDPSAPPADFFPALAAGAIAILQRIPLTRETSAFLHRVREAASIVAYDIDDQIFDPTELEEWRIAGLEATPARYARAMALADHFLVSTAGLRAKVERRFRRPAHVVTNALGTETLARSRTARRAEGGPFVIGYASGSHTHDADLAVVLPALERFLRDHPGAELHCVGRLALPKRLREEFGDRVQHRKAVPWRDLPDELARFTVQVVPLADCPFNRCKSHIRFLEAAAVGVPSIVSAVGEPASTLFDGVTGFTCGDDPDDWYRALARLHDDPALRARMGGAGRRFVTEHFTTASRFLRARVGRVLEDLDIGLLRDDLGLVVGGRAHAATALPFEVLGAGAPGGPEPALVAPSGADPAATARHLLALTTARFACLVRGGAAEPGWDLRLVQAAKAVPRLGWLSLAGGEEGGTVDRFPGGFAVTPTVRAGDGPLLLPASAAQRLAAAGGADIGLAARRIGLYTGALRGTAAAPAPAGGPLVAIKVCTPVAEDENVWGDTHYARGLQAALRGQGYDVRIDKLEAWHDSGLSEVAVQLFGIAQYRPDPAAVNILWIISHPDRIDADFVAAFDHVFCASEPIAARVRALAPEVPTEVLLQCTDTAIFFPDPSVAKDIDIAFVGNSRKIYRDAVRFAVEEGFDVAIWGTRWEPFVDRRLIRGESLTSEEVADVYRRARIVLNDHWEDQKAEGLVNNRVFDALACDTTVLSDANPGLASVLGGAVPTFVDRTSFAATLRRLLADPEREATAARLGAEVREAHTFTQRAAAIHAAIAGASKRRA